MAMEEDDAQSSGTSSSSAAASSSDSDGSSSSTSQPTKAARSGSARSTSSSSSDEEDGNGEEATSLDDDLFGISNDDYMKCAAESPLSPPKLPPLPTHERRQSTGRSNRGFGRGGETDFSRSSPGLFSQGNNHQFGTTKSRDLLVAEMKLGAAGHQDHALRHKCPPFQEPQQIACYSRTAEGDVHFDDRCLRRFRRDVLSDYGADLNEGFESFVEKREDSESAGFGDLLACIRNKRLALDNIHFVTFRNNLNKILGTAYNRNEAWEMGVHKRHGTIYLDVHKLPENSQNEHHRRICYWGYSFERLATESSSVHADTLWQRENGTSDASPVDANVEYCSVIRTKLGPHRIIMGAEIDCYEITSSGRTVFVELKTSRELDARTVERFEREKLLKFWIQSFLAGVPRIVCGYRDDTGRLLRSEMMGTSDITQRVKAKRLWEGGICLTFADQVFCWLFGSVKENGDYVLRFLPGANRLELYQEQSCPAVITEHVKLVDQARV